MHAQVIEARFSSQVYDLEIVKRAAYRFTDRLSFNFLTEKDCIICQIAPVSAVDATDMEHIINDFKNEVLDQDLRRTIADETASIRNVILAHVFSKTGLQSVE